MRVLAIIDAIELTGPGKGLLQLAEACRAQDAEVIIANFVYEGRRPLFQEACVARGVRVVPIETRGRFEMQVLRQLETLVRDEGITIVQSHSLKPHIYALLIQRRLQCPWLAFAHGWTFETWRTRLNNALERRVLRHSDHVVVPSELLEQDLRRHGRHKPVSVIMNAIARLPAETTPELRGAARHALGLNAADYVVACIGRLSYEKAQDLLLQSLNGVHPTAERPIILLLAGDGPFRGQLEEAASLQGHVDVRFLGHLADVTPLYVACDLVVMPSRTEAAPNVVLEAMSYGLPIIATRVGAVPAMVSAGRDALLVDACDVAALAEKIQRAYEDAELFSTLGKSARGAVWPRFSVKRRVESIVGIYAQLSGASRIPCASP